MSIAKLANGTLLKIGSGTSVEVFTTIPEVMRLRGPATRFDLLDVSSHDTVGLFREYIPGMADGDVIGGDLNWRPGNAIHIACRVDSYAATLRNFRMVFPDTPLNTVSTSSYITEWSPEANVAEVLKLSFGIKVTGAPVWS